MRGEIKYFLVPEWMKPKPKIPVITVSEAVDRLIANPFEFIIDPALGEDECYLVSTDGNGKVLDAVRIELRRTDSSDVQVDGDVSNAEC